MTPIVTYSSERGGPSSVGGLTAVILAGGLGTRLRPVIGNCPKVLAPVSGRPFLTYLLHQLQTAGLRRVVLCTGYLGEQVQQTFGDRYGALSLAYSQESEPLGTAGALGLALPLLESDPMLVMNGDSYCEADLGEFLSWQRSHQSENSLLLTYVEDTRRFGRVQVDDSGVILRFEEKQTDLPTTTGSAAVGGPPSAVAPGWINAGIYLLSRQLLNSILVNRAVSIEREVFPSWIGRGLRAYQVRAPFLDIGTPDSYAAAQRFFHAHALIPSPPRLVVLDRDGTINVEKHYL